jgi:hypothetical protein
MRIGYVLKSVDDCDECKCEDDAVEYSDSKSIIASSHIGDMLSLTDGERYTTIQADAVGPKCRIVDPVSVVK